MVAFYAAVARLGPLSTTHGFQGRLSCCYAEPRCKMQMCALATASLNQMSCSLSRFGDAHVFRRRLHEAAPAFLQPIQPSMQATAITPRWKVHRGTARFRAEPMQNHQYAGAGSLNLRVSYYCSGSLNQQFSDCATQPIPSHVS